MAEGKKVGSIYIDLGLKADSFQAGINKAHEGIKTFATRVKSGLNGLKNFIFSWKTFIVGAIAGIFGAKVIGVAVRGLKNLVSGVIEASSTYEQLQLTLRVLLKDQNKANEAFNEARDLAAKTAFSIEEITSAYAQLLTFKFEQKEIPRILLLAADAATAFGKNIDEVIRSLSYLKAGRAGEALESLARFGISREALKSRGIEFESGGELKSSYDEVLNAIYAEWESTVGGMSKEGQKTWKGMISNLKDAWTDFKAMIGKAGIFDSVKNAVANILDKINEWSENGKLKKWADDISRYLTKTFNSLLLIMSKIFGFELKSPEELKGPAVDPNKIKELEKSYAQLQQMYKDNNMELGITFERYKQIYGATEEIKDSTKDLMTIEEEYNQMKRVYADNNIEFTMSLDEYKEAYKDTAKEIENTDITPKEPEVFDWAKRVADKIGEGSVLSKITDAIIGVLTDPEVISKAGEFGLKVGEAFAKAVILGIKNYQGIKFDPKQDPILWLLLSGGAGQIYGNVQLNLDVEGNIKGMKFTSDPETNAFMDWLLDKSHMR